MHLERTRIPGNAAGQGPVLHRHRIQAALLRQQFGACAGCVPTMQIGKGVGCVAVLGAGRATLQNGHARAQHERGKCDAGKGLQQHQNRHQAVFAASPCAYQADACKGRQRHPGRGGPMRQAGASARQIGQQGKGDGKEGQQQALRCRHQAQPCPTPQQQGPKGQQLHQQKTQQVQPLPTAARAMLELVDKRDPVVVRVPDGHRTDQRQRQECGPPQTGLAQQRQSMGRQQAQGHSSSAKDGGVFAQARQTQQQTQQQPLRKACGMGRLHQAQGLQHEGRRPEHQQGVGQQAYAQNVQQGRQQQHGHGPKTGALGRGAGDRRASVHRKAQRHAVHQQQSAQPKQSGQEAQHHRSRTQRHQRPLDPTHQRRMVKVTERGVGRIECVMGLVHRQAQKCTQ